MKLRPFEIVLVTVFALLAIVSLALVSTYKSGGSDIDPALTKPVVIWGTLPENAFVQVLRTITEENKAYNVVSYKQIDARSFDSELVNALSENRGPDIVLMPSEKLVQNRNKIQPFAYTSFPLRDFKNLYIDGAEIFTLNDGVYSYPIAIDPLVMYYNRDLLASKNIINPPATWEDVVNNVVPKLIKRDFSRNIILSPIAFGDYSTIRNSYGILSMLLLQGGSLMVTDNANGYQILLNNSVDQTSLPLQNVLTFYTRFDMPSDPLYSWNRSLTSDREQFLSENLALYFGKGSEAVEIAAQNPNLNFDVAEVPQGSASTIKRTYASFYGLSLLKSAHNQAGALVVLRELGSAKRAQALSLGLNMAPAYRSTLLAGSNDRFGRVNYTSSLYARGWLSPNYSAVDSIFKKMVEDVLSNTRRQSESADDATGRLRDAY